MIRKRGVEVVGGLFIGLDGLTILATGSITGVFLWDSLRRLNADTNEVNSMNDYLLCMIDAVVFFVIGLILIPFYVYYAILCLIGAVAFFVYAKKIEDEQA